MSAGFDTGIKVRCPTQPACWSSRVLFFGIRIETILYWQFIKNGVNMEQVISATQARIHFGEVMRRARQGPVIVERDGIQEVVVLSKQSYDQLISAIPPVDWREKVHKVHERLRLELRGRELPDPADVIQKGREERDEQLLDSLR